MPKFFFFIFECLFILAYSDGCGRGRGRGRASGTHVEADEICAPSVEAAPLPSKQRHFR